MLNNKIAFESKADIARACI